MQKTWSTQMKMLKMCIPCSERFRMHQDIVFYNLKKITFNIVSSNGK